jgi:hypothetical protein
MDGSMALSDYISQRIYDVFRIKGTAENSSVDDVTVAASIETGGSQISDDNPFPVSFAESLLDNQLISNFRIKDELIEINMQLKILNKYMSKWHGEEITHEEIKDDNH